MNVIFLKIFIFVLAMFGLLPFLIILAFIILILCYIHMCRAAIEEQYAKALMKLSKSTLADNEEG